MAKTDRVASKAPIQEDGGVLAAPETIWDRMIHDWQARPRFYLGLLAVLAVVVAATILGVKYFKSADIEEEAETYVAMTEAMSEEEAEQRLVRLRDLQTSIAGTPREPYYWFERARAARDAVNEADDPNKKLEFYRSCLEACEKLESSFPKSPWVRLPWKTTPVIPPGGQAPQPQPSLVARLADHARSQIAWLEKYKGLDVDLKPDADLVVTLSLDIEGEKKDLKIRLFSAEAPYAVDNFLRLIREGYFADTHVYGLQQDDPNTDDNHAVLLGSALSKLAPDRSDLHGGATDDVGYTLPLEGNRLREKKGRIALELRREQRRAMGADPVKLVIYTSDPLQVSDRLVFGEIEESSEALAALAALEAVKDEADVKKTLPGAADSGKRILEPVKRLRITGAEVSGSPASPPPVPLEFTIQMPEKPEPLEKDEEKQQPDDPPAPGAEKGN